MLTKQQIEQLFRRPYPYINERKGYAVLVQTENVVLPIALPLYPLALALQETRFTPEQRRDLALALLRRHPDSVQPSDLIKLEQLLQEAPLRE